MGKSTLPFSLKTLGWLATSIMAVTAAGMLLTSGKSHSVYSRSDAVRFRHFDGGFLLADTVLNRMLFAAYSSANALHSCRGARGQKSRHAAAWLKGGQFRTDPNLQRRPAEALQKLGGAQVILATAKLESDIRVARRSGAERPHETRGLHRHQRSGRSDFQPSRRIEQPGIRLPEMVTEHTERRKEPASAFGVRRSTFGGA